MRPAQEGPEPGEQFAAAEGLGQVIVGPGVQRRDLVVLAVAHGQDEDGRLGPFAQAADDGGALHVGEAQVEDDAVRLRRRRLAQAELSGVRFLDAVAGPLEHDAQEATDLRPRRRSPGRPAGRDWSYREGSLAGRVGKVNGKAGAAAGILVGHELPALGGDEAADDRQAEAQAAGAGGVAAREFPGQLGAERRRQAGAAVGHDEAGPAAAAARERR